MNIHIRLLLIIAFSGAYMITKAAQVDSLDIPSTVMKRNFRAVVVLPDSYAGNKSDYPVMYLLHGAYGHFNNWLNRPSDKTIIQRLADEYNLIIVMPDGDSFSFYLDSPLSRESLFETYLTQEVIKKTDSSYRTVKSSKGRVITGLSMGGHGALYLAIRHPDIYCAAGSMSGTVDLHLSNWKISKETAEKFQGSFDKILGKVDAVPDLYATNSVINLTDKLKTSKLQLIFDCGVDDFLIDVNRKLHKRLLENNIAHDYTERPGGHSWDYWQNALPYHVLFFYNILKTNGLVVSNK